MTVQSDDALPEIEAAKRFEDTVRRMANTPPAPTPARVPRASRATAEDKAIAALQARIATYFRGLTGLPSREDYIKTVLGSFPKGLVKADLGVVAARATNPSVGVCIDPLFYKLAAHAAEQWHCHAAPPTVSGAPKASS